MPGALGFHGTQVGFGLLRTSHMRIRYTGVVTVMAQPDTEILFRKALAKATTTGNAVLYRDDNSQNLKAAKAMIFLVSAGVPEDFTRAVQNFSQTAINILAKIEGNTAHQLAGALAGYGCTQTPDSRTFAVLPELMPSGVATIGFVMLGPLLERPTFDDDGYNYAALAAGVVQCPPGTAGFTVTASNAVQLSTRR
jgi:hypothetical protein